MQRAHLHTRHGTSRHRRLQSRKRSVSPLSESVFVILCEHTHTRSLSYTECLRMCIYLQTSILLPRLSKQFAQPYSIVEYLSACVVNCASNGDGYCLRWHTSQGERKFWHTGWGNIASARNPRRLAPRQINVCVEEGPSTLPSTALWYEVLEAFGQLI